jgi:ATP-dependent Clp protease adaptor protein ClpS
MAGTDTLAKTEAETQTATPWNVIVHDDPVNLMDYVTWVLMRVFGYAKPKAAKLMREVHEQGRSVVWSGEREKAEFFVQQLQAHQLKTTLENGS